jgi:hypothetical protein
VLRPPPAFRRDREPDLRARARRPSRTSMGLCVASPRRSPPTRAQHRGRPRRYQRAPARRRTRRGGWRYILGAQLHLRPAVRRPGGSLASRPRRSAAHPCGRAGAEAASRWLARARPAAEIVSASQWWTYRNTKARRELGFEPRPHEETLEDAVGWQLEELGNRRPRRSPDRYVLRAIGRAQRVLSG